MLIKYWIENYKSFYKRAEFHMQPAPRLQQLSYSVLNEKAGRKKSSWTLLQCSLWTQCGRKNIFPRSLRSLEIHCLGGEHPG